MATPASSSSSSSLEIDCQLASFGGFVDTINELAYHSVRVFAASDPFACAPHADQQDDNDDVLDRHQHHHKHTHQPLNDAIVLVQRGKCSFNEKLRHVQDAGGYAMVLINQDDSLIQLGALEWEEIKSIALSMRKTDGDKLLNWLVQDQNRVHMAIWTTDSILQQCANRIEYFMTTNVALVAYETFFECVPIDFDEPKLVNALETRFFLDVSTPMPALDPSSDERIAEFFDRCARLFSLKWEFGHEISRFAALASVVFSPVSPVNHESAKRWIRLADQFAASSSFSRAEQCLHQVLADHETFMEESTRKALPELPKAQCKLALMKFLQGELEDALPMAKHCLGDVFDLAVNASEVLDTPRETLVRLASIEPNEQDRLCLSSLTKNYRQITSTTGDSPSNAITTHFLKNVLLASRDDQLQVCCHPTSSGGASSLGLAFSSFFVEEMFDAFNIMGVFLDEFGGFEHSLVHFQNALLLCGPASSLHTRLALAVPVVLEDETQVSKLFDQIHDNLQVLNQFEESHQDFVWSSIKSSVLPEQNFVFPERSSDLRYTITPPTMFIGYQGIDVLAIQQAIAKTRRVLYPSLTTPIQVPMIDTRFDHQSNNGNKKIIGFISAWFHRHSVGKLMLGIIQHLDRSKFQVNVYRARHFFQNGDELTSQFAQTADRYIELPPNQQDALEVLRNDQLEVLIYGEIGMDAWMVFLAFHRLARVQCVFWGHPITTGNAEIDYFISSELFISDFDDHFDQTNKREDELSPPPSSSVLDDEFVYHNARFQEQVVLFEGMSTFFSPPKAPKLTFMRAMLHLPANRHIYLCPQTLMKLHPAFDQVLFGILRQDPDAYIVLLYSTSQTGWKDRVRARWRRTMPEFPQNYKRILFYTSLPFDEFMGLLSIADVMLDPFPFGGGVTTLDALTHGLPVVTLPSAQSVMQLTAGFYRHIGVLDCIASNVDHFIRLSVSIASDMTLRNAIRDKILAHHAQLYQDEVTIDQWNTFLAYV